MFLTAAQLALNVGETEYVLSVGFEVPDDIKPNDFSGKLPELKYNIGKIVKKDDINATIEYIDLSNDKVENIIQLKSTAELYSKGFNDCLAFVALLFQQEKVKSSKNSDIII